VSIRGESKKALALFSLGKKTS